MASERLVKTQVDWDSWDRSEPPGEHLLYWESLTEPQLDERFRYLAENGWDPPLSHPAAARQARPPSRLSSSPVFVNMV